MTVKNIKYYILTSIIGIILILSNYIFGLEANAQALPRILSVTTSKSVVYAGDSVNLNIKSVNSGKVQYKVLLSNEKTGKWEDVSGGYSSSVDSSKLYSIKLRKTLQPGRYKISVWTKRAGTTGKIKNSLGYGNYDNYLCISKECYMVPQITSINTVENTITSEMRPSIKVTSKAAGKVQYKALVYTEKTGKWEDASNGYSSPVSPSVPYTIKLNKTFSEGKYKISVWVKQLGSSGRIQNIQGLGSYDNYSYINKECISVPRISSADILEGDITSSTKPSIRVITNGNGQVQYRALISYENTGIWEDASNGYSSPVDSNKPYIINFNRTLKEGKCKISIWVKRAGIEGIIKDSSNHGNYDNCMIITKEISYLPKVTSVALLNPYPKEGENPTITIKSSWRENVQYKILMFTESIGKWEDVSNGYLGSVNPNTPFNITLNKSLSPGNYKIAVLVKRSGIVGEKQDSLNFGDYDNNYIISFICKSKEQSKVKIVVDAGHGGSASGAVGPTGTQEKDVTLSVALKLGRILQNRGVEVIYTRTDDSDVSLGDRSTLSNNSKADLFVSIHCNSYSAATAGGTETYSYKTGTEGEKLAKAIQNELLKATQLTNRGTKTANYYVIKYTSAPAVLTELAFISNPKEESLLNSDSFQDKCANAIADGIMNYIKDTNLRRR